MIGGRVIDHYKVVRMGESGRKLGDVLTGDEVEEINTKLKAEGCNLIPIALSVRGVITAVATAKKLGWTAYPEPHAILSQPFNGRAGCIHCGFCLGFACEVGAKSSTAIAMMPQALDSGNCELRTLCTVARVETNDSGRVSEVVYWDEAGVLHAQKAKAAVLCANGAETPRLLLLSESSRFPDGLANGSGMVGFT